MKSYSQFCPVAKAAELFCERWTALIIRDLALGASRFSELRKGVPLMSPTLLSQRLKQLQAEGVIDRKPAAKGRGATYHLTRSGNEFVPLVEALGVWGQRWTRRELEDNEVDLGLLLWSVERSADAEVFGEKRAIVQLDLTDQPAAKRNWWFLNEGRQCRLCLKDPGFDVDLYLRCSLPDMIYIVRGDLPLDRALATVKLEVIGTTAMRRQLRRWLNLGPLSKVPSQRGER